jgi:DNA polymerase-3 subunit gamma/tau
VLDLIDATASGDAAAGLDGIHTTLDKGSDPRQFARQVVDYLRDVLLVRMGNANQVDATAEEREKMAAHAAQFEPADLLRIIQVFNTAASDARGSWQPSLPLELALVEAIEKPVAVVQELAPASPPGNSGPSGSPSQSSSAVEKLAAKVTGSKKSGPRLTPTVAGMAAADWEAVKTQLRKDGPSVLGLVNSAQVDLKENVLRLGFQSEDVMAIMEAGNKVDVLVECVKAVTGKTFEVACFVAAGEGSLPEGIDPESRAGTAVRSLGAEIVDINELEGKE